MAIKKKENIHFECFLLTNSLIKKRQKTPNKTKPKKERKKKKKAQTKTH